MLLVHVCCADCLLKLVEVVFPRIGLSQKSIQLFFYNPNIHPEQEHLARQKAVQKIAKDLDLALTMQNWTPGDYFGALCLKTSAIIPDKSVRCPQCYKLRLDRTVAYASQNGFSSFTTTLLTSRYHDREKIITIGLKLGATHKVKFVPYEVPTDCLKTSGFYKQNYEGCVFSLLERMREKYAAKAV
jgi:hypothetical protein